MHMATSLGVKWQPWSEIGPYRGVQAAVNGQEFAITYPQRSSRCGEARCERENGGYAACNRAMCRRASQSVPGVTIRKLSHRGVIESRFAARKKGEHLFNWPSHPKFAVEVVNMHESCNFR
jgi:hypothetical protein